MHKQDRAIPRLQTGSRAHTSHSLFGKMFSRVCPQHTPQLDYLQWSRARASKPIALSSCIAQYSTAEHWELILLALLSRQTGHGRLRLQTVTTRIFVA